MAKNIFSTDWWLAAVAEGHRVTTVSAAGCSMPCIINRHMGIGRMLMPRLTQAYSVETDGVDRDAALKTLAKKMKMYALTHLVVKIDICLYISAAEADIFAKAGYGVERRVSYQIAGGQTFADVLKRFAESKRRYFRKGTSEGLTLGNDMTAEEFYDFAARNFEKRGASISYKKSLTDKMIASAMAHEQGTILSAITPEGHTAGAVLLVWDDTTVYYLIPSFAPEHKQSHAMEWLTGECIRFALERGKTFDFEGSMVPSYAKAYSSFGSEARDYYHITLSTKKIYL